MLRAILLVSLLAIAAPVCASNCSEPFAGGIVPKAVEQRTFRRTTLLCFTGYAVLDSGLTLTPLWSAEHLTVQRVEAASRMNRVNAFHPEERLPPDERAELGDYRNSGYDRGHMAPSGDMPDAVSQQESFSLANMIPQNGPNNRGVWEGIESATRDLALRRGDVYVVTGPIFKGDTLDSLHGRVLVPTMIFKAVYDVRIGQAAAYVVENEAESDLRKMSIDQLRELSGIDVFPALPDAVKAKAMALPDPVRHTDRLPSHHRHRRSSRQFSFW